MKTRYAPYKTVFLVVKSTQNVNNEMFYSISQGYFIAKLMLMRETLSTDPKPI